MKIFALISICLFLTLSGFSQRWFEPDSANLRKARKHARWDTTRYHKFKSNLIIGYFQSYRDFDNEFQQFRQKDTIGFSKNNYFSESRLVSGFDFTYDKFSLSLGFQTTAPAGSSSKGKTKTFTVGFNVGGNIWYLENSYRYFKGFYDKNTPNYDSNFKHTGIYLQQPSMQNTIFRSKFLYFTNHHRFAFRAGYDGGYRQLKSAASWVLGGNIIYNNLRGDSSFFPLTARSYYGDYGNMNGLRVIGISANAGAAATIVIFKGFFFSAMFIVGPEQQWRTYDYMGSKKSLSYVSWSGDGRASIGFNLKRFYILATTITEFSNYNSSFVGLTNRVISGNFTFGFRFRSKTPEFYKKVQQTRVYLLF